MAMRRLEPPVPLTVQGLGIKLDRLADGQSKHEGWLHRLAEGQERHEGWLHRLAEGQQRHATVLDLHSSKLNELIAGQNAHTKQLDDHTKQLDEHTRLLNELIRSQAFQTELLEQLVRGRENPAAGRLASLLRRDGRRGDRCEDSGVRTRARVSSVAGSARTAP